MMSTGLAPHQWEAGMCRGFGETLGGPALTWFINLPYKSIESYQQLADKFVEHFASSCKLEKTTDDLNAIQQWRGESLRSYVSRFNKERITIPDLHQPTAVEAFRNGLLCESGLYKKLTKFRCYTMDQAMARAQVEIRWEEDKRNKRKDSSSNIQDERKYHNSKRHKELASMIPRHHSEKRNHPTKENQPLRKNFDRRPLPYKAQERVPVEKPRLPDYNFSISPGELVLVLKKMGNEVRWPPRNKENFRKKDTSKWCEFHRDYGHTTAECVALRLEVLELLNKGFLRDLLIEKRKATLARRDEREG